jgi:hypothetical protein
MLMKVITHTAVYFSVLFAEMIPAISMRLPIRVPIIGK